MARPDPNPYRPSTKRRFKTVEEVKKHDPLFGSPVFESRQVRRRKEFEDEFLYVSRRYPGERRKFRRRIARNTLKNQRFDKAFWDKRELSA